MSANTANLLISLRLTTPPAVEPLLPTQGQEAGIQALSRRLAAGDERAFEEFHALFFDRLYQFLLVLTHGQEIEAREALQETLLRVARYARAFETEEIFWCWLKAVARSATRDAGRKQHRYLHLLQRFAFALSPHREQVADHHETVLHTLLQEALAAMPPADRSLIEGKYLEGFTVKELALDHGLSEKAAESRLARARQQLRERLLKKLGDP